MYPAAKNVVFGWTMGITHHLHGVENVRTIANLALLRGMVGRPRRGAAAHSRPQQRARHGIGRRDAGLEASDPRNGSRNNSAITLPAIAGPGHHGLHARGGAGRDGFGPLSGRQSVRQQPRRRHASRSLGPIENGGRYLTTTLNTGHAWGSGEETLILPVLPRDEEPQPTTQESMFSFVRMSDGGPQRFDGPRSEVSILAALGQALFADGQGLVSERVDWKKLESHAAIRELIAELIPEYAGMKHMDESKEEFHVPGRAVEDYRFPTATGRAKFHSVSLPEPTPLGDRQLRLMTIRSEGQFNAVVYDEEDIYRRQERRDVILMNPLDIKRFGFEPNQRVKITSTAGEMRYILVREYDIRAGNAAMYFPEANVLVPHAVDPLSKTPGFKHVVVTLEAEDLKADAE